MAPRAGPSPTTFGGYLVAFAALGPAGLSAVASTKAGLTLLLSSLTWGERAISERGATPLGMSAEREILIEWLLGLDLRQLLSVVT